MYSDNGTLDGLLVYVSWDTFRREGGSLPGILPRPPDELCRSAWACLLNRAGPPSGGANGRESIEFLLQGQ